MNTTHDFPTPPLHPKLISQDAITIQVLVADDLLDPVFDWLCQRRKDWPSNADVWRFRRDWSSEKTQIQMDLLSGTYEIGLLDRVTLPRDGQPEEVDL
ncbi:MAG: hypothetical protein O7G88_15305 [bacterium]|nr:hypothetical protein [bacterium]